ncbi:MAG TPA: response regulator transcription factor [Streptosporangiaceae bacterium]|jgi:DNA-binding NarL/FixJ family response regulator
MADRIRVLLADDHPVVREGLRTFLGTQDDIEIVGEAATGPETVERAAELSPDVVLLDLKLPGLDGIGVLQELRERGVSTRALVLTSVTGKSSVVPAVREGAAGYLYKDVDPLALAQAIRSVHDGHLLFAPEAVPALLRGAGGDRHPEMAELTDREREVLAEIARGRSNREIARTLAVAEKTVKTHVSSLFTKLGVQDRTQAALFAVRHGVSSDD